MAGRATNMIDAPTRRDRVASEELAGEVRLKSPSKDGQLNPACWVPDCERTAGEFGDEPGNFECPHAVTVDREGTVFVSDRRKLPSGMMKMVAQLVGHDENEIGAIGHVFPPGNSGWNEMRRRADFLPPKAASILPAKVRRSSPANTAQCRRPCCASPARRLWRPPPARPRTWCCSDQGRWPTPASCTGR